MCFDKLFGSREPATVVQQQAPAPPPAPPAQPADAPTPDEAKSGEAEALGTDKTGFSALIIPRTALPPASKNVASG